MSKNITIPISKHQDSSWSSPFSSMKSAFKRNLEYTRAKYGARTLNDVTKWGSVLAAETTITLDDVDHMQYFGNLKMGSGV